MRHHHDSSNLLLLKNRRKRTTQSSQHHQSSIQEEVRVFISRIGNANGGSGEGGTSSIAIAGAGTWGTTTDNTTDDLYSHSQSHPQQRHFQNNGLKQSDDVKEIKDDNKINDDDDDDDDGEDPLCLTQSIHSFLFTEPISSLPFWFGIIIAAMSYTCLILALLNNAADSKAGNLLNEFVIILMNGKWKHSACMDINKK